LVYSTILTDVEVSVAQEKPKTDWSSWITCGGAIVAAIIGCVGTILAAVYLGWFTKTPTPIPEWQGRV
jgi:hypothetical protein